MASAASVSKSLSASLSITGFNRTSLSCLSISIFFFLIAGLELLMLTILRKFLKSKLRLTRLFPFLSLKAGCLPSIPESIIAHVISLQLTLKRYVAASALTAGTDLEIAGIALRLSETCQTRGFSSSGELLHIFSARLQNICVICSRFALASFKTSVICSSAGFSSILDFDDFDFFFGLCEPAQNIRAVSAKRRSSGEGILSSVWRAVFECHLSAESRTFFSIAFTFSGS